MPKVLNWLLLFAIALMFLAVLLMVGFGLSMLMDTGIREQMMTRLSEVENAPSTNMLAMAGFGGALLAVANLFVLNLLRKIVGTLLSGDPFVPENISRLRLIWIIIAVAEIFRMLIFGMADISINPAGVHSTEEGLDIRLGAWFMVFVIAALAEVFRHGAELRRDAELTV